jgi:[acyl-carrier-protein] S-malonyltransferase
VAAGSKAGIDQLIANPPERARVIELRVAGAFHTFFMESAEDALRAAATLLHPADPAITLLSNRDGKPMQSGAEFLEQLVLQVSRPVRWDLCMATMDGEQTLLIELPPAGALSGLAKRGMPKSQAVSLKTPDDLVRIEG